MREIVDSLKKVLIAFFLVGVHGVVTWKAVDFLEGITGLSLDPGLAAVFVSGYVLGRIVEKFRAGRPLPSLGWVSSIRRDVNASETGGSSAA